MNKKNILLGSCCAIVAGLMLALSGCAASEKSAKPVRQSYLLYYEVLLDSLGEQPEESLQKRSRRRWEFMQTLAREIEKKLDCEEIYSNPLYPVIELRTRKKSPDERHIVISVKCFLKGKKVSQGYLLSISFRKWTPEQEPEFQRIKSGIEAILKKRGYTWENYVEVKKWR